MQNQIYEELLGLPQLQVNAVSVSAECIDIYCESTFKACHCPVCLEPTTKINQCYERTVRDLPISGRRVSLHLRTYQFECERCKRLFYEQFSFVDLHQQMTTRYERYIYQRCIGVEIQYVVVQEDLCWKTVDRIFKKYAEHESVDLLSGVRALGIDEIALKKGHNDFACVLVNLETGQVIDVLPERTKAYLIEYFKDLGSAFCAGIAVFSSDMWSGFISTGEQMFPNAMIVVDRFHFFAHIQKALDKTRKALRSKYKDRDELKRIKYLLLKNKQRLTEAERQRLDALFAQAAYVELKQVYQAKEALRAIFESPLSRAEAEEALTHWEEAATKQQNRFLAAFLKTFKTWKGYVVNYFQGHYSNGIVEGINNKIKLIKRRAFGYVNFDNFRRRVIIEFAGFH